MELNNEIILLRKSLKSIVNQTRLNLAKKIKIAKKQKSNERKENELNCFKRVAIDEIPLSQGLYPDKLRKVLTDKSTSEIERIHARILLNSLVQKTLIKVVNENGLEKTQKFIESNEKKVKRTATKKISEQVKERIEKAKEVSDQSFEKKGSADKSKKKKKVDKSEAGKFVKNPNFVKLSDESESEAEESAPKSADPFFVDVKSGGNYLSAVNEGNSESSDEDEEVPVKKRKMIEKPTRKIETFKPPAFKKMRTFESDKPREIKTKQPAQKIEKPTEENLHPSWIAKQQQKKLQIQEFQGTKIKFDD